MDSAATHSSHDLFVINIYLNYLINIDASVDHGFRLRDRSWEAIK